MKRMIMLLGLLALLLFLQTWFRESRKEQELPRSPMTLLDSIYTQIIEYELEHPEIVYSQALLESNYASSDLYISNNNLFGMKASGDRATTSNLIVHGYKYYSNWKESILDYALFQMAYYKGCTEEEYLQKLGESYATDSMYIFKIKKLMNSLKQ